MSKGKLVDSKTINGIELELRYTENKQARQVFSNFDSQKLVRKYSLLVKNNGESKSFNYYGSVNEFKNGEFSKVTEAFNSVLLDALSYDRTKDIDEFAAEFGITKPSQANKTYNACKSEYNDLKELGIKDIYEIKNKLDV